MLARFARPLAASLILAGAVAASPQATLKIGDPAPALSIAKWIKGEPVAELSRGQVYVVEFWATWCGPCIAGMPHLSDVSRHWRDKDVTVVSVTSEDPGNSLEAVEAMVAAKGSVMDYTVAWDDGRKTNDAWMRAAEQNGIPCSFIVDKAGRVTFIGHPMWLDIPLAGLADGTWEPESGMKKIAAAEEQLNEFLQHLRSDPAKGLAGLKEFEKNYPGAASQFVELKFQLCLHLEHYEDAYAICSKLVDQAIASKDASRLNQLAWIIVDPQTERKQRDLVLALRAAAKAVELTKGEDADILDTLARVHFTAGDVQEAIAAQKKAVALDPSNPSLSNSLKEYEAAAQG